ncbi:unnamed protein product (macronuclear) [Paramecium tetraurelia]|uniref:Uncharacterized protein n=1 Tax=Paramecium tetraurelia TaxID=5888 RepID=A0C2N9_PARTE|nr:uncharacterized protein GSPATT00034534001 [Paramecium tetraurelia]CAK65056.1 unnamed protein product [Paramecium tetraurelia]|eukprot:XP_001432453.1 hypothetical protein (macronuclear) [Paramecium tetraurelia strain d4-2]
MNSIIYIYIDSQPLEIVINFSSLSNIQYNNPHYSVGKVFLQKKREIEEALMIQTIDPRECFMKNKIGHQGIKTKMKYKLTILVNSQVKLIIVWVATQLWSSLKILIKYWLASHAFSKIAQNLLIEQGQGGCLKQRRY